MPWNKTGNIGGSYIALDDDGATPYFDPNKVGAAPLLENDARYYTKTEVNGRTNAVHAHITGTGTQSVGSATTSVVILGTQVRNHGMTLDLAAGRIHAITPGIYLVTGGVIWSVLSTGFTVSRHVSAIYKNGVLVDATQNRSDPSSGSTHMVATTPFTMDLAANDHVSLACRQETGVTRTVDRTVTFLQATWLGPTT